MLQEIAYEVVPFDAIGQLVEIRQFIEIRQFDGKSKSLASLESRRINYIHTCVSN
jgi:hypothetical protein